MIFDVFKNVIIEQNKILLKSVADSFELDYEMLLSKYLTPDHYLPIVQMPVKKKKTPSCSGKASDT